jgi:hypothetical protein
MSDAALQRIIAELDELEPAELARLWSIVAERLTPTSEEERRRAFHEAPRADGLVHEFNFPAPAEIPERRLIEVIGEPAPETIIKERR